MAGRCLGAVVLFEIIAGMLEGSLERPCRYVGHIPWVWLNEAGPPFCGVCRPPAEDGHA